MSGAGQVPDDRKYTKTHEWVVLNGSRARLGITDHAQGELTDVVFVDLPPLNKVVAAHQSLLVLESVKTVADVYAPADAKVVAVNEAVKAHPELVNKDPYGQGWLVEVELTGAVQGLLSPAEYRVLAASA